MKNPKSVNAVSLAELIDALKEDLAISVAKRPTDWKPLFRISEAVVECAVMFDRTMKIGGKLSVLVAELGPEAAEKSSAVNKISLKLIPLGDEIRVEVARPNPLMRGARERRPKVHTKKEKS